MALGRRLHEGPLRFPQLHEGSLRFPQLSFASGRPSRSTYFLRGTPKKLLPSGTKKSFMGSDARTYGSSQM